MLRAIVALVAGLASAQAQAACTAHADCLDTQYCSNYTLYSQVSVLSCYECVDSWGMSCTSYGDSVDGSCERCAGAEAQNAASSGYNYTNCASSDECGDSMYCYRTEFDGYAMQDCWPCSDDTGKTCEEYGDAVEGSCSSCTGALPATNICSSHLECPNDSYCSSYENSMGTGIIVACNPCLDTWGYTCEDYDDAIDGSCQICAGASGEGSSSAIAGAPPSSSPPTLDNQCQGPLAPGTQIAFQSCSASTDCRKGEYCSAYWAFPGCVIDCWPCEDMYSLTCADYGDAIDRSCDTCSAAGGKAIVPAGCERHADCAYGQYCALVGGFKQCAACRAAGNSSNSTCQSNSFDADCAKCEEAPAAGASPITRGGVGGLYKWRLLGIAVVVVAAISSVGVMCFMLFKVYKAKYGKDDALALRGVVNVRQDDSMPPASNA